MTIIINLRKTGCIHNTFAGDQVQIPLINILSEWVLYNT